MIATVWRAALVFPAAFAVLAGGTVIAPAIGHAAVCGPGTVYDAPTDMCVAAPAPAAWNAPPPPPAAPPPPSVLPPGMPPVQICPPIPFVAVCFPVS
jgi:hypothetical protein